VKEAGVPGTILNLERIVVYHGSQYDIVHYRMDVTVGPGTFDVIKLHRIVKEQSDRPVRTADGVMFLPGQPTTFEALYAQPLVHPGLPWDRSIATYLAKNNIDVWGIDYAWALVPLGTTDFSFMKGWGLAKDVQHIRSALSVARSIRMSTGQSDGPINLIGLSYGALMTYAVAGDDKPQPPSLRNVKGIIPLDMAVRFEEQTARQSSCDAIATYQALIDSGVYQAEDGIFAKQLADLATNDPGGDSPFFPGMTNYQFVLFAGAAGNSPVDWHFVGANFDANGIPTSLRDTDEGLWVSGFGLMPPYYPNQQNVELNKEWCGKGKTPLQNHFRRITVPILYVGAAGGYGRYGVYTTGLTASGDITIHIVQLLQDDQRYMDYGHADLVMARNAETTVWSPILDWIVAHR